MAITFVAWKTGAAALALLGLMAGRWNTAKFRNIKIIYPMKYLAVPMHFS